MAVVRTGMPCRRHIANMEGGRMRWLATSAWRRDAAPASRSWIEWRKRGAQVRIAWVGVGVRDHGATCDLAAPVQESLIAFVTPSFLLASRWCLLGVRASLLFL